MDDSQRDLEAAVEELSETLRELRAELREPPTGPLGMPRPPTPGEFLRFTEQYTLPALISLLETAIRTLELLGASIRLLEDEPVVDDRPTGSRADVRKRRGRVAAVGRTTLEALDEALAELQAAAPSGQPMGPEVQRLLAEARDLGAEVDARLAEATTDRTDEDVHEIDVQAGSGDGADGGRRGAGAAGSESGRDASTGPGDGDPGVDVDAELDSIKDELDGREQPGEAHGATEEPLDDADDPDEEGGAPGGSDDDTTP